MIMETPDSAPFVPMCQAGIEDLRYLVHFYLTIQFLSLCGLILVNSTRSYLRIQRQKEKEGELATQLDIERQTRQPCPTLSALLNEHSNHDSDRLGASEQNETTPLLSVAHQQGSLRSGSIPKSWYHVKIKALLLTRWYSRHTVKTIRFLINKIHAWTMLQPNSIPIFGSRSSSNGVSLGIATTLLVNIGCLLVSLPMDWCFFLAVTRRAAVMYTINIPMLYFLSIRAQPWQKLTSWSHVDTNIFHRRLGGLMACFLLIHSTGHILPMTLDLMVWDDILLSRNGTTERYPKIWKTSVSGITHAHIQIGSGLLALFGSVALILTSTSRLRRTSYRIFLRAHSLSHIAVQFFLFVHSPFARLYIGIAIASWVLNRFVFRKLARIAFSDVTPTFLHDGKFLLLSMYSESSSKQLAQPRSWFLRHFIAPWSPGCHIFLKITCLVEPYDEEWHPCYLMSAKTNTDAFFVHDFTQFLIVADGPWSRHVLDRARFPAMWGVELEGPYGSVQPLEMIKDRDICILVASIPGMASILPIAQSLVDWHNGYHPVTNTSTPWKRCVSLFVVCYHEQNTDWLQREFRALETGGIECKIIWLSTSQPDPDDLLVNAIYWKIEDNDAARDKRIGVVCCGSRDLERIVRKSASSARSQGHRCLVDTLPFSS